MFYREVRTSRNQHQREKARSRSIARQNLIERGVTKPPKRLAISGRVVVPVTAALSLSTPSQYEFTLDLVRELRNLTIRQGKRLVLDMGECPDVSAAAALKLHAEINVMESLRKTPGSAITVILPKARTPRVFLARVGFGKPTEDTPDADSPGVLPLQSHTKGATALPQLLGNMNKSLYNGQAVTTGDEWMSMSTALQEAMLNVNHHAYTVEQGPGTTRVTWPERADFVAALGKRWWIIGETHGRQMFLAIYDKGVGIPQALNGKDAKMVRALQRLAQMAVKRLGGGRDSGLIKAAMALGRSGTKRAGRGYGLAEILRFVLNNPMGSLVIYSNKGIYQYTTNNKVEILSERKNSIHGTLIQWNSSLPDSIQQTPVKR